MYNNLINQLNRQSDDPNPNFPNQTLQPEVQSQPINHFQSFQTQFQRPAPMMQSFPQTQSGISQSTPYQMQNPQVALQFPFLLGSVPIPDDPIQHQQMPHQSNHSSMPNTIEDLKKEIQKEQKKIEERKKTQHYLITCTQLLHNPEQLKSATKKLEQYDIYLKDMQTMLDEKIKNAISCIDLVLNEK